MVKCMARLVGIVVCGAVGCASGWWGPATPAPTEPGPQRLVVSSARLPSDPAEQKRTLARFRACGFNTRWCIVDLPRDGQRDLHRAASDWQPFTSAGIPTLAALQGFYTDPMQDQHGHPIRALGFGSFASQRNLDLAVSVLARMVEAASADPGMAPRIGARSYLMLYDQPAYWHHGLGCFADYSPDARRQFVMWLRDVHYRDKGPADDSNRDGHTFRTDTGLTVQQWADIAPPRPMTRTTRPFLWYLWMRYREWSACTFFQKVEQALAPHKAGLALSNMALGVYPNVGPFWGNTQYYRFQACSLPSVSESMPDHPGTSLGLCQSDQLNTWLNRPPLHWVFLENYSPYDFLLGRKWDWRGTPYTVQGDASLRGLFQLGQKIDRHYVARAMAHGFMHRIRGWVIQSFDGLRRDRPDLLDEVRYWTGMGQTHAAWLSRARPVTPQIALLFPWTAGIFEPAGGSFHKHDFVWGSKLLLESHYPVAVVTEDEIVEKKVLRNFRALYLWSTDRLPPGVGQEIVRFVRRGGHVFGSHNALASRIARDDPELFGRVFGARLDGTVRAGRIVLSPTTSLDIGREPLPNRGLIATARLAGASLLGSCRGKVVGTFTPQTVWIGSQPGHEVFSNCSEQYVTCELKGDNPRERSALEHDDYRRLVAALARRAKLPTVADVSYRAQNASHIEVGMLRDPQTGVRWYTFINHEGLTGPCQVRVHGTRDRTDTMVWDLLRNRLIEERTDGRFTLRVPSWGVSMVLVGRREPVRRIATNHALFYDLWRGRQPIVPTR